MNKVLTILIPAFNEQANIKNLLSDLLAQNITDYSIQRIIVASDGSTDQTVKNAKEINSKIIEIIDSKRRLGKNARINQIFKGNKNDIVVVLDADIKITDKNFLSKLVNPIGKYDLTSSRVETFKTKSYIEKILNVSIEFINNVSSKFRGGNNVYTCRGVARAFSVNLSKSIKFPSVAGDDAYSYFYAIENNFKYKFINNCVAYIALPNNFKDHLTQSERFESSQKTLLKLFPKLSMKKEYKMPSQLFFTELIKIFFEKPALTLFYIGLNYYTKMSSNSSKKYNVKWDMAVSSKKFN